MKNSGTPFWHSYILWYVVIFVGLSLVTTSKLRANTHSFTTDKALATRTNTNHKFLYGSLPGGAHDVFLSIRNETYWNSKTYVLVEPDFYLGNNMARRTTEQSVMNCCPENILFNGSFENQSPNLTENFPNATLSPAANSRTVIVDEWNYEDGETEGGGPVPLPLINDPARATDGSYMLYLPLFSINNTQFNRCIGDNLPNNGNAGECPPVGQYNNGLRYVLRYDWVILNENMPNGGAGAGGGLPAVEYFDGMGNFLELPVYDEEGEEYEVANGLEPAVAWADVASSWQTAYALTNSINGPGASKLYFSNVNPATAGMLIDDLYIAPLQIDQPNVANEDCGMNNNQIAFTLNPSSNLSGSFPANYVVSAPAGYTVAPTVAPYGVETTFTLTINAGDFNSGTPVTVDIELEDEVNDNCSVVATVTNPYPCVVNPPVTNCCPENILFNGSFENQSPNLTENFPNATLSPAANSRTVIVDEWNYEDGETEGGGPVPLPLINDPARATDGSYMLYLPLFSINNTQFNRCIGDNLPNNGNAGECPPVGQYNNGLRYVLRYDWVILNENMPNGGAGAGGGLPAVEYFDGMGNFLELPVYDEEGEEYEVANGLEPAVAWADVASSWQTAYALTNSINGPGASKLYFSNVNPATAGMLIDDLYIAPLQIDQPNVANEDCGMSDDQITFTLNPSSNLSGSFPANYVVSAPAGYTVAPMVAPYGVETTFTLTINAGDFTSGTPVTVDIELEDEVNDNCSVVATVTNPYPCIPPVICEEKRLDWDVEDWIAGTTNATFPIGLTEVEIDIQTTQSFGTYQREVTTLNGTEIISTLLPDDNDELNMAGAMVGDGEALDIRLTQAGALLVDLDFSDPVGSLMFSILDIDGMESVSVSAEKNGLPVNVQLSSANPAGPISVVGNMASGTGGNSDNDSDGTVNVTFTDSVDLVVIEFTNTLRVALSDLKICAEGMSVGNLVWNDIDNDGLVDVVGEPGVRDVQLKLYKDEDMDGQPDDLDPVDSTTTDANGNYLFDNMSRGKYLVWIDTINFALNAPLDSFSTSLYTEIDPEDGMDANDNGLNTTRKNEASLGIWSGTIVLSPGTEPLMGQEPDQGMLGSGTADDENSDLTVDFGVLKDSDYDGAENGIEGYGDRDGDGIANVFDFDPAGYVYCQLTGEIVKGGTIELVGAPPGGEASFEFDGSSGFYQFFINSVPGTYTIAYTPPPGFNLTSDPGRQPSTGSVAGAFDPTPGSADNPGGDDPVVLGEGDIDGGTVQLSDFSAAANPYYYSFDLNPDPNNADPFIFNNNIPLTCACDVEIDEVEVNCTDGDNFSVTVDVSWVNEDPEGGDIEITLAGQTVVIDPGTNQTGTVTSPAILLSEPAFGEIIEVEFTNNGGCTNSTLVDLIACTPSCVDNSETDIIGGQSWLDTNDDGVLDAGEIGQPNVQVLIYACDNPVPVDTVYTNENGEWSSGALSGGPFRVEFSQPLSPWLDPSFTGADNGSNVQFVEIGNCSVDYGLLDPTQFCQEDLNVSLPCYVSGDPLGGGDSQDADWIVSVPYPAPATSGLNEYLEDGSPVGSTWGAAFQKQTNSLFFSAFMKRHSGFGTLGTGGIYLIDVSDPANPVTNEFLDLDNDLNIDTGSDPRDSDPLPADKNTPNADALTFDLIGKQSLGDIDVSEDGETMWVMNLFDRTLYELPIGVPAQVPVVSDVTGHALPDPGCLGGEFRPFAVKARRGLVYVGGVCSGESNAPGPEALRAYVFVHDPAGPDGNFTEILSFGLDYPRGNIIAGFAADWRPWIDEWTDIVDPLPQGARNNTIYPQPMLSDIEFTDDGSMLLGFTDRVGHQTGNDQFSTIPGDNNLYQGLSGGDLLKACYVDGVYQIEDGGSCGGVATTGADSGFGPGGGEFFWQDMFRITNNPNGGNHNEIVVGGLAYAPGSNEVGVPVFDPLNAFRAGGIIWMDTETGARTASYEVFGQDAGGQPATFGKAGAFGDMEVYCSTPIPIQVGNYAWIDADGDGVQDACEMPIPDLPVSIYDSDGNLLASTLTDENGNYYFSSQSADDPNLIWLGADADTALIANTEYSIVFGTDGAGNETFDPTTGELMIGDTIYQITINDTGEGSQPDINDSDVLNDENGPVPGFPTISFSTETSTDHTLDAGFEPICPFVELVVMVPSLCGTDSLELSTLVDSINRTDIYDYFWSSDGTGEFVDASGAVAIDYTTTTAYVPSELDASGEAVTFTLMSATGTTPSSCPLATDSIFVTILRVDCGSFPWGGN